MNTRTDLINYLIKQYNLQSYLEIGLQNANNNFNHIRCQEKTSVDPDPVARAIFHGTSDEFFERYGKLRNPAPIDLVFVDGLHHAEQAARDTMNAIRVGAKYVVLHDCYPDKEEFTQVPRKTKRWFGDVYKVAVELAKDPVNFCVVDMDCGCGVLRVTPGVTINTKRFIEFPLTQEPAGEEFVIDGDKFIRFEDLSPAAMNLKSVDEFKGWLQPIPS